MGQRVQTTQEERERIAKQFTSVVNALYDKYLVNGYGDNPSNISYQPKSQVAGGFPRPFRKDDVKITQVWSDESTKAAHLATADQYWKLGIRFTRWRDTSPLRRFKTHVHEAAHLPGHYDNHLRNVYDVPHDGVDTQHPFQFWLLYATLADRINDRYKVMAGSLFDAPITGGPVICNAINEAGRYASGIEMAQQWQRTLLDHVDYDDELYEFFRSKGVQSYRVSFEEEPSDDETRSISVSKIDCPRVTDRELYDEFEEDIFIPGDDIPRDTPELTLPASPRLSRTGAYSDKKYRVEDGDEAIFAMLLRRRMESIECRI